MLDESGGPSVDDGVSLLVLYPVARCWSVDPDRGGQYVTGVNGMTESPTHRAKASWVRIAESVEKCTPRESIRTQTMKNRTFEPGSLGEDGIGVKRIAVARESKEQRLVGTCWIPDDLIRWTGGGAIFRPRRSTVAAKAALASNEEPDGARKDGLTGCRVHRLGIDYDEGTGDLVVDACYDTSRTDRGFGGQLTIPPLAGHLE